MLTTSVIIAFYNNIEYLKLVLAGYEIQNHKDFELIIADDGSKDSVVKELNDIINRTSLNIKHIWHEDKGWRKNEIINKAIQASTGNYLIFADADCIPHHAFIKEHVLNAEDKTILAGRRVNIPECLNDKINRKIILTKRLQRLTYLNILVTSFTQDNLFPENGIYIRCGLVRKFLNKKDKGVLGSNFSVSKSDILAVNGFDERYKHATVGEDTDIEIRLRHNGVKVKTIKHLGIQYHLYHPRLSREYQTINLKILNENIENNTTYTPYGIHKKE